MSEKGKKTSIYVGDPIQRVKQRLRDANSTMTLSARMNQIAQRYQDFIVDHQEMDFTQRELDEIAWAIDGMEVTASVIRALDSIIENDRVAEKIARMESVDRLRLIEQLGL